jgi:hypothetical protein
MSTVLSMRRAISGVAWNPGYQGFGRLRMDGALAGPLGAREPATAGPAPAVAAAGRVLPPALAAPADVLTHALGTVDGCDPLGCDIAVAGPAAQAAVPTAGPGKARLGWQLAYSPAAMTQAVSAAMPATGVRPLMATAVSLRGSAVSVAHDTSIDRQTRAFMRNDQVQTLTRRHARSRGPSLTESPV